MLIHFLLKVHNDRATGVIDDNGLNEILNMCISYVLRRNICEIPTNSLNKTFATFKNSIRSDDYMNSDCPLQVETPNNLKRVFY